MKLYLSTDSNQLVVDPLIPQPINAVSFKRGDAAQVELVFVTNYSAISATAGKKITFGIKESGKYDGTFLTSASAFTTSGNAYVLKPSFNTVAINSLLNSGDGNDGNDVASINTMLEITWSDDNGLTWHSSSTITATIQNDVCKGLEGTALESPSPVEWLNALRPLPISVLDTTPIDATIESLTFNLSGTAIPLYRANSCFYSSTGEGSPPSVGTYYALIKEFGFYWVFIKYVDNENIFSIYSSGTQRSYNPIAATWPSPNSLSGTWTSDYTPGELGQLCINESYDGSRQVYMNLLDDAPRAVWYKIIDTYPNPLQ